MDWAKIYVKQALAASKLLCSSVSATIFINKIFYLSWLEKCSSTKGTDWISVISNAMTAAKNNSKWQMECYTIL